MCNQMFCDWFCNKPWHNCIIFRNPPDCGVILQGLPYKKMNLHQPRIRNLLQLTRYETILHCISYGLWTCAKMKLDLIAGLRMYFAITVMAWKIGRLSNYVVRETTQVTATTKVAEIRFTDP